MFFNRLLEFQPVSPGNRATLRIPRFRNTLNRIVLTLGGTTFTKALISKIEVLIGTRPIISIESNGAMAAGTILDMVNRYKGIFDQATNLTIDFNERDFLTIAAREMGGIDLTKIEDDVFVAITIASGAAAPTLYATGGFTPPQGGDIDAGQLVAKLISIPYSFTSAGRQSITFDPKGALIKRIHTTFTGTNGSATVQSNLSRFEVAVDKYNVHDLLSTDNKFIQQEYRKVPIAQMMTVDFCVDNNLSGALVTAGKAAIEFNPTFIAGDSGVCMFEVLDAPYNL